MTRQIRGIGDPLVAIYVRCYLIRIGSAVIKDRDYMKENFLDFLFTFHYVNIFYMTLVFNTFSLIDKFPDIQHKSSLRFDETKHGFVVLFVALQSSTGMDRSKYDLSNAR